MCILCNSDSLRLLVAPLDSLSHEDLGESVRVAREAAMQLVLDTADALDEFDSPAAALRSISAEENVRYVVDRAERDGVAELNEVREWNRALREGILLADPRVQAFLSSGTEGLAAYLGQIQAKLAVLERFLEVRPDTLHFGGIGPYGEISFDLGDERYIVLSEEEGMQIAMDRIASELWQEDPQRLLRYSNLPDDAVDILMVAQKNPEEKANEILAGIVDLPLLAEDSVRQVGFGGFVAAGLTDDFVEQRFGDLVIVRLRLSDVPHDEM